MQIASGYKVVGDLQDPWLLWREVFKKLYGWFARGHCGADFLRYQRCVARDSLVCRAASS